MASQPVSPEPPDALNEEQFWELLFSLQGSATAQLESEGGVEAWMRFLRGTDE